MSKRGDDEEVRRSALLAPDALEALREAGGRKLSYGVRVLVDGRGTQPRVVVMLGETHLKLAGAWRLGKKVVDCFSLRGVERFQSSTVAGGRLLRIFIEIPRLVLRALSLGSIKGSTITYARQPHDGVTVELEGGQPIPVALHVGSLYLCALFALFLVTATASVVSLGIAATHDMAQQALRVLTPMIAVLELHLVITMIPAVLLRSRPWCWLVNPAIAILSTRDAMLTRGVVRMLEEHQDRGPAVIVVGRAHLAGIERQLVTEHQFMRVEVI